MAPLTELLLFTTLAGACMPLGGLLARLEHLQSQWLEQELRHAVIAFGGGVLIGAVALVLVPQGSALMGSPLLSGLLLMTGGAAFMLFDRLQAQRRKSAPQLSAMLADFIPESLALGGMFAADADGAVLLALLIGLQNLPEGFNAWRELRAGGGGDALLRMSLLVPLGPGCAIAGWWWLAGLEPVLGGIMLFAAGGILYLTFQDIAPQAPLKRHWSPPLGAVLGFALAMLGNLLIVQ